MILCNVRGVDSVSNVDNFDLVREINNDILHGEIIQKSYKLNKSIAQRFSDYCKELRGSGIKSQDILSMALLEFLQKRHRQKTNNIL